MNTQNKIPQPTILYLDRMVTYVIIDLAHFDINFYRELHREKNLRFKSLFANTPDESSAFAGPVLIEINPQKNQSFIEKLFEIEKQQPAVTWLWSKGTFGQIFNTLQPLLYGELEDGKKILCRYYDPRCIEAFLQIFNSDANSVKNIQEIKAWAVWASGEYQYLGIGKA